MDKKQEKELNKLIGDTAQNEKAAFSQLYALYEPMISSAVRRYCPQSEPDMREDIRQEAALALFRAACSYREDRAVSFGAYAKVCIENSLTSMFRRRRIDTDALDEVEQSRLVSSDSDPSDICIGREESSSIMKAVRDCLSDFEKKVFSLYILQLPTMEIATSLNTSEKSVENAVYRIRIKLKKLFC